jgi:hypothetical protein
MRNESHAGKKGHKEGPHSTHCDDAIWQQTKKKKPITRNLLTTFLSNNKTNKK